MRCCVYDVSVRKAVDGRVAYDYGEALEGEAWGGEGLGECGFEDVA